MLPIAYSIKGRGRVLKGDYESAVKLLDEHLAIAKQMRGQRKSPAHLMRSPWHLADTSLLPQALNHYAESYRDQQRTWQRSVSRLIAAQSS
jgi:hypothetical protein